ncbi:chromosome partitioning protein, ParB family [Pseudoxanthobacter soli DSM 19599]|uniref:Chromosome partitioning protein, ParB family n=1 Tax=Pseudoxanthobacter soli DSM 19599 TaxID=1123029 RepID=A0A1M7ZLS0_9HYPH|nr:ParB/RepB/Spo0J family partition protein [Pseudoxanthobacter soli]SHO65853.1 chromosome partitioning protein, ParB family [Pseudoxanthobacter soli DSM 19599]
MIDSRLNAPFTLVPIASLAFGHEAAPPLNARRHDRDAEIAALAESIVHHGLIQPLTVTVIDGRTYVVDGNRRLAALRRLQGEQRLYQDEAAPCVLQSQQLAGEISLAANVMRLPLHPADQYEAFRALADDGQSEADIAARFGLDTRAVRRTLALGRLHPVVLDGWRAGRIDAAEAQLFTLARDQGHQAEVYGRLAGKDTLDRYYIRRELGVLDDWEVNQQMAFVGAEAYRAAGGYIAEDLFGDRIVIHDRPLLARLAEEKLGAIIVSLVEDGWSWAHHKRDVPGAIYRWKQMDAAPAAPTRAEKTRLKTLRQRLSEIDAAKADSGPTEDMEAEIAEIEAAIAGIEAGIEARGWTPEIKARSGCIVDLDHQGKICVRYGLVKPEESAANADGADDVAGEDDAPATTGRRLSRTQSQRASEIRTTAAAQALADDPHLALAVAVAALQSYRAPARLYAQGWHGIRIERESTDFATCLATAIALDLDGRLAALARLVAASLDLTDAARDNAGKGVAHQDLVIDLLDGDAYRAAMAGAFDPVQWFGQNPASESRLCMEEVAGRVHTIDGKKATLVSVAVVDAAKSGWLPPELRSRHYRAPDAEEQLEAAE